MFLVFCAWNQMDAAVLEIFLDLLFCCIGLNVFFCQYHDGFVTIASLNSLKSGIVILPTILFFAQNSFVYLGSLVFPYEFYDSFFFFCEESLWISGRDCKEFVYQVW
jgi:hypothetical protein